MQIKQLLTIFSLFIVLSMNAQNDFSAQWTAFESGDTINENPFNGSFKIRNEGATVIAQNDTLWYGYLINGELYDLSLNEGLVSGRVLEADFNPEDEITIVNPFEWPFEWDSGDTLDFCAVVFGVGYESYTDVWYTGDDNISNNTACIKAVTPIWSVAVNNAQMENNISISLKNGQINITNLTADLITDATVVLTDINGRLLYNEVLGIAPGNNNLSLANSLSAGLYILSFQVNGLVIQRKFSLS